MSSWTARKAAKPTSANTAGTTTLTSAKAATAASPRRFAPSSQRQPTEDRGGGEVGGHERLPEGAGRELRAAVDPLGRLEHDLEQRDHPEQRQRADAEDDRGGAGALRGHARNTPPGPRVTTRGLLFYFDAPGASPRTTWPLSFTRAGTGLSSIVTLKRPSVRPPSASFALPASPGEMR